MHIKCVSEYITASLIGDTPAASICVCPWGKMSIAAVFVGIIRLS